MRSLVFVAAAAAAAFAFAAHAQPYGPGPGPGAGPGPRAAAGPRFNERTTPGWSLMTARERREHQERMRAFAGYEECNAYMVEHHKLMAERAKARGGKLRGAGPGPGCDWLKKK